MVKLNSRQRYLQIALNGGLADAQRIIGQLPASERIIIEAGTPLIKQSGIDAVAQLNYWWQKKLIAAGIDAPAYIGADMKTIDRGATEA